MGDVMSKNTVSDQVWNMLIQKHGGGRSVMFDPPTAGKMTLEYQVEMKRLGFCSYCEGKLGDENHPDNQCQFKIRDEQQVTS